MSNLLRVVCKGPTWITLYTWGAVLSEVNDTIDQKLGSD